MTKATLIIRIGRHERSRIPIRIDDLAAVADRIAPHISRLCWEAPVAVLVEMPDGRVRIVGRYPQGTVFVGGTGDAA